MERIPSEAFVAESRELVEKAEKNGLVLRIMGALGVRHHALEFGELHAKLARLSGQEFTDIDFMSYGGYRNSLERFFEGLGYQTNRAAKLMGVIWGTRHMYDSPMGFHVDVFFDRLEMSHTIDFRGRLELDRPTVTLADLLLEKMQIVKINEKDIKDSIVLLRAHAIGDTNKETVDAQYIATLLSNDWGLHHTVTSNLNRVRQLMSNYEALSEEDVKDVSGKLDTLLSYIANKPKSAGWKIRARIGTKKKWYTDVEDQ